MKISRNDPCPCGSGKKYKKCCMRKEVTEDDETSRIKSDEMVHIGKIKEDAIGFMFKNFEDEIEDAREEYPYPIVGNDTYANNINFLDWFLLEREARNGKTPIELFLDRHPFPEDIKKEVRGWRNPIHGVFRIVKKRGHYLQLYDEIDGRFIHAGITAKRPIGKFDGGDYLITRLTPWRDFYLLSGAQMLFSGKDDKFKGIIEEFREEELKLRRSFNEIYKSFVDFFGTDEITGSASEIQNRILNLQREITRSTGKTLPRFELLENFRNEKDVGCIVGRDGTLHFFRNYGLFKRIFEDGSKGIKGNKGLILSYLENDSPKLPFEKIKNMKNAPDVFKWLFGSNFDMDTHFDAMIEKYSGERKNIEFIKEKIYALIKKHKRNPKMFIDTVEKDTDVILLHKPAKASFYLNFTREELTFRHQWLGIECLKLAREYFKDIGDTEGVAESYVSESNCYRKLGDFTTSLELGKKALEMAESIDLKCRVHLNISCDYLNMKKYAEGIEHCEKIMKMLNRIDDEELCNYLSASFCINLGSAYMELGNYEKVVEYYERAIELCGNMDNKELLSKLDQLKRGLLFAYTKIESKSDKDIKKRFELLGDVLDKLGWSR